ncbi:MAG: SprT-like domain-containing protein [Ruminiclostridium sp.]|nr:SprT-like domain-containing protein [Ruminiclostridium sp.]
MRKRNIYTMAEAQLALMNAFNSINEHFFENELEKVIITLKEGAKKNAFGWIETTKNWKQGNAERHEINISSDYLERPVNEIIATLMHEMCHLYALQHDIKDTSRANIYHNKKFKEIAESHGLITEFNEHIGYSHTIMTETTAEWVNNNVPVSCFKLYKKRLVADSAGKAKPKQSSRKYVCPCCGLIVRATKECNIICADCDEKMEIES